MMTLAQFFATHKRADAIVVPRQFARNRIQRRPAELARQPERAAASRTPSIARPPRKLRTAKKQ
jgi:hypothetical protein